MRIKQRFWIGNICLLLLSIMVGGGTAEATQQVECAQITQISQTECQILQDINNSGLQYNTGYSINYDDWFTTDIPCLWSGVGCNGSKPYPVEGVYDIVGLRIINSGLTTLPNSLGNLSNLSSLLIRGNDNLQAVPATIGNLSNLTELDVRYNATLTTLPDTIGTLSQLDQLYIGNLSTLPNTVGNLSNLTQLTIEENDALTTLPTTIENLSNVTSVSIRFNGFSVSALENIGLLPNVRHVEFFGNQFTMLPDGIGNITTLTSLQFNNNDSLTTLPDTLGNLSGMSYLEISNNDTLVAIPNGLGNASNLTTLRIQNNRSLNALPDTLGDLDNLTDLEIVGNSTLSTLPDSIGELANLRTFDLSGGRLTSLPDSFGNLPNLMTLTIGRQTSEWENGDPDFRLPESIGNLSSLTELNISGNNALTTIPNSIGNLSSLERLYIWNNDRLKSLPITLDDLTNLNSLSIRGNNSLVVLPNTVGSLADINQFEVWDNYALDQLPSPLIRENLPYPTYSDPPDTPIYRVQQPYQPMKIDVTGGILTPERTGHVNVSVPPNKPTPLTIRYDELSCPDPTNVRLIIGGSIFTMGEESPGIYAVSLVAPADINSLSGYGVDEALPYDIEIIYECADSFTPSQLVGSYFIHEPMGQIVDALGSPVAGAKVTLYRADSRTSDDDCYSVSERPSNGWSELPSADVSGVDLFIGSSIFRMDGPRQNFQLTDANGYYGWGLGFECWYVRAESEAHQPVVSPVVGMPPEVTDLDLVMLFTAPTSIAVSKEVMKTAAPFLITILLVLAFVGLQIVSFATHLWKQRN